jgi:hypothetical protein
MDDILYFDSMIHSSLSTFFFSSGVKDFRSGNPEQRMEKVFLSCGNKIAYKYIDEIIRIVFRYWFSR